MSIPNTIHLIWLSAAPEKGGKPFSLVHYLAVRSMRKFHPQATIKFHYDKEPETTWWERARPLVTPTIAIAPKEIAGQELHHVAHQADILRLRTLHEEGGIYLDMDIICVRSLEPLLRHPCVLGSEGVYGLCNAVILAEPRSEFIRLWLEGYDPATSLLHGFRSQGLDDYWNEMSIKYPKLLADTHPDLLRVEPEGSFFWPLYSRGHLQLMFEEPVAGKLPRLFLSEERERIGVHESSLPAIVRQRFSSAYCHHLWETASWNTYLRDLDLEKLAHSRSKFAEIVGPLD